MTAEEPKKEGYWLYLLRCGDGSLYTGITNDLPRRLAAHRAGRGAKYTRGRGPLELVYQEFCPGKAAALRREAAVKRLTRADKLRLAQSGPPAGAGPGGSTAESFEETGERRKGRAMDHEIIIDNDLEEDAARWETLLRAVIPAVLEAEGVAVPCEVDVLLTDDDGIHQINLEQRGVDHPTDVLSFPMFNYVPGAPPVDGAGADPGTGRTPLGDMVLSLERARAQGEEYGHGMEREVAYLCVHSVLHLLGYDHMDEGAEKARMRAREEDILGRLGLSRGEPGADGRRPEGGPERQKRGGASMETTKCGMIAIIGRPNVGKSTLTNALVGEKIAIVTHKPQTTRNRICAVCNRGARQFVFLDTPGLHRARTRLDEYMAGVVSQSVADVDAAVLMVEPVPQVGEPERELIGRLAALNAPAVLAVNKIDTVKKEELLAVMRVYQAAHPFRAIVPVSARRAEGLEELLDVLEPFLAEGPRLFPDGMVTDQPERQVCAEILREKLLLCLDKEIPHGTAVELTRFSERVESGIIDVDATIYCEKASHKGIIIGKGGARLKEISSQARRDMETFMGTKVYLQTWVKVKEHWRDNVNFVHQMGYRCDN